MTEVFLNMLQSTPSFGKKERGNFKIKNKENENLLKATENLRGTNIKQRKSFLSDLTNTCKLNRFLNKTSKNKNEIILLKSNATERRETPNVEDFLKPAKINLNKNVIEVINIPLKKVYKFPCYGDNELGYTRPEITKCIKRQITDNDCPSDDEQIKLAQNFCYQELIASLSKESPEFRLKGFKKSIHSLKKL